MSDISVPPPPPTAPEGEDKTAAILAYITLIGFIIAIILNSSKKTQLGAYHLRQALGFMIAGFVAGIGLMICSIVLAFIPVVGWLIGMLLTIGFWVGCLVLMVMGIMAAANGQMKPLPVIGEIAASKLGKAFE